MINKFTFGQPVYTGATVQSLKAQKTESFTSLGLGTLTAQWPFQWDFSMEQKDIVWGLGENVRGMNKRGFHYTSWCLDNPHQSETEPSLYAAHNFILVNGTKNFGVFFDTASKIDFDIGYTDQDTITVTTQDTGIDVYFITPEESEKNELNNIVRQFRTLIGQSYIPPLWGFGYQQSRWGYKTEADVRNVVNKYRELNIPLDSVVLDIDYMQDYMDFTVDKEKFPNLKALCADLLQQGIHLIPIIDAGVKVKPGYSTYDEGIKNNYFATKEDGTTPYAAGVWPGRSHFTDFFNDDARRWFGDQYKKLTDQGIEGFWNDMNEPAMFYSDESLEHAFKTIESYAGKNLDVDTFFEFTGIVGSICNNPEDYKRFYHKIPGSQNSQKIRHDKIHNIYGAWMTRAAGEGLSRINPDKRMVIYSRASCIGAHRYGGIWTGDNSSTWAHLEQEIKMLPGVNMCGFLYSGADIGGFGADTTRDLLMRWLAFGVFTPLMRNHAAWNTREQEIYAFKNPLEFKSIMDLRYSLIPYIYSEFVKAAVKGEMFIKPLAFDYTNDERAATTEDQLLIGNELMIAPVYQQNARGRYVYLPEDMTMVTWQNSKATEQILTKGDHWIEIPLDTVVFFVRKNKLVPLCPPAQSTDRLNTSSFYCLGTGSSYELYTDDGFTTDIHLEGRITTLTK